jgi:hypothetical protein
VADQVEELPAGPHVPDPRDAVAARGREPVSVRAEADVADVGPLRRYDEHVPARRHVHDPCRRPSDRDAFAVGVEVEAGPAFGVEDQVAARDVEDPEAARPSPRRDPTPVLGQAHAEGLVLVDAEGREGLPGLRIPESDPSLEARGDEAVAVGEELELHDHGVGYVHGADLRAGVDVVERHRSVGLGDRERPTVGTEVGAEAARDAEDHPRRVHGLPEGLLGLLQHGPVGRARRRHRP